jgi:hypothetical protein
MPEINRSLIIVTVKQPFIDWAHLTDPEDDTELNDINDDPTAYLVPEYPIIDEQEAIIDWCATYVFENELMSWCTDEELWPTRRDAATFREWFDVKFHSMVNDIVADIPLKHIDYGEEEEDVDASANGH